MVQLYDSTRFTNTLHYANKQGRHKETSKGTTQIYEYASPNSRCSYGPANK